jgi:toxin-antitoxin system PIN domain toxin
MMIDLPDVNVIVALLDAEHQFHREAMAWFREARQKGWATCPLTENGTIRVLSRPQYPGLRISVSQAAELLRALVRSSASSHVFWQDSLSILNETVYDLGMLQGYGQITDIYLLGLCQHNGGTLLTMDKGVVVLAQRMCAERLDLVKRIGD